MMGAALLATTLSLAGEWALTGTSPGGRPVVCVASVPGDVQTALVAAGVIPDTFFGTNELIAAWVNRTDWTLARTFTADAALLAAKSVVLRLEDVDTFATICVNGTPVGRTTNRFRRWEFDVKPLLRVGANTVTGVFRPAWTVSEEEAARAPRPVPCNKNGDVPTINYIRKPQCHGGWDWGITQMTAGFCGTVELIATDDFRIDYIHSDVRFASDRSRADVRVFVELTEADGRAGVVTNDFALANPRLWWPRGLGEPNLTTLTLDVRGRKIPHRLALRTVELVNDADEDALTGEKGLSCLFRVNGRDVFAKGANWIPCDAFDSRQTPARYRDLLESAVAANMNMIRVWGGGQYEKDVFYDLCDELGLMVWQDFMFACGNYPGGAFLDNVRAEAEHQVKRLKDHGSIVVWAGDNECRSTWRAGFEEVRRDPAYYYDLYRARTKLLGEVVARIDPGRTFWPASPCNGLDDDMRGGCASARGDVHYWGVWHGGLPFRAFGEVHPRFCSEFGFQSYPSRETCDTFLPPGEARLDSPVFSHHQKNGGGNARIRKTLDRYFSPPRDFDALLYLSQVQQALAIRTAVEMWRAEKPWCMGTLFWQLNDNWPVSSWSSIEYGGKWKHLHYHARRFYADVAILPVENPWNEGRYFLSVVNDTDADVTDDLVMERWNFDGKAPLANPCEGQVAPPRRVTVPAGQVRRFGLWWGNVGFTTFRFGEASGYWVSAPYRDCPLAAATVTWRVTDGATAGTFRVTLTTDYPAFFVWVNAAGIRGEFDDNSILLLPNAPRTLTFTAKDRKVTRAAFERALTVRHLQESVRGASASSQAAPEDPGKRELRVRGLQL